MQVWIEIDSRTNSDVLTQPTDVSREELFSHRIGDADDHVASPRGVAFGDRVTLVDETSFRAPERRTFDRHERRSVNGVHDRRPIGVGCFAEGRQSAENSGFAAVRVDDIGTKIANESPKLCERASITEGTDFTNEIGQFVCCDPTIIRSSKSGDSIKE
jgi:hypothetical protein